MRLKVGEAVSILIRTPFFHSFVKEWADAEADEGDSEVDSVDEADTRWGRRWAADVSNAIGAKDSVTSPETAPRKAGVSNAK